MANKKPTKQEFLKEFWLKDELDNGGWGRSHTTITILSKHFTDDDIKHLEDYLYSVMDRGPCYGFRVNMHGYELIEFDIRDWGCECTISDVIPDAFVIEDCGWDDHYFNVAKNGKEYNRFVLKVDYDELSDCCDEDDDEPEEYYDIDCSIYLRFKDGTIARVCTGGGMCTPEEHDEYLKLANKTAKHFTVPANINEKEFHLYCGKDYPEYYCSEDTEDLKDERQFVRTHNPALLSTDLFTQGYRIFVHPCQGEVFEIGLGKSPYTSKKINMTDDLIQMLIVGDFDTNGTIVFQNKE
jgi:hypothetical protein